MEISRFVTPIWFIFLTVQIISESIPHYASGGLANNSLLVKRCCFLRLVWCCREHSLQIPDDFRELLSGLQGFK